MQLLRLGPDSLTWLRSNYGLISASRMKKPLGLSLEAVRAYSASLLLLLRFLRLRGPRPARFADSDSLKRFALYEPVRANLLCRQSARLNQGVNSGATDTEFYACLLDREKIGH